MRIASTCSTALDAVAVEDGDDLANLGEEVVGHHEFGAARAQDRSDADAGFAGELRDRRQGGKADAAPEDHDVLAGWIDRKSDPERPDHVELVADFQRRKAVSAAADAFVEKLDAAVLAVDPVDALRAAQPQLAGVRGGAEQIEELAGLDRERLGRGVDDEVLVFGIDPVVGDDRAQRFLGRDVMLGRCGRALAHDVRCRCERPVRHIEVPPRRSLDMVASYSAVPAKIKIFRSAPWRGIRLRLRRLRLQPLRRVERRNDDVLIPRATAQVAGDGDPNLLLAGVWIVAQEFDEGR